MIVQACVLFDHPVHPRWIAVVIHWRFSDEALFAFIEAGPIVFTVTRQDHRSDVVGAMVQYNYVGYRQYEPPHSSLGPFPWVQLCKYGLANNVWYMDDDGDWQPMSREAAEYILRILIRADEGLLTIEYSDKGDPSLSKRKYSLDLYTFMQTPCYKKGKTQRPVAYGQSRFVLWDDACLCSRAWAGMKYGYAHRYEVNIALMDDSKSSYVLMYYAGFRKGDSTFHDCNSFLESWRTEFQREVPGAVLDHIRIGSPCLLCG